MLRVPETDGWLIGLGVLRELVIESTDGWAEVDAAFCDNDWWFASLSYDLKNRFERLNTRLGKADGFPLARFVCPEVVLELTPRGLRFLKGKQEEVSEHASLPHSLLPIHLDPVMPREHYLKALDNVMYHLHRGDIYEVNYCQEWRADAYLDNPFIRFIALNARTRAPHAAYVQYGECYILCGSPERFIRKQNDRIVSQPIKGTIRRGANSVEDAALKERLMNSAKDKAENVMIVDLVRNDLARIAQKASVVVDELHGVHTFQTVHHLVSTISAKLSNEETFSNILRATFPMGSMTGAPKVRAMQIADALEASARGMYSGSVGYKEPNGNFDFNVVIRAIIADLNRREVSCKVGGAITVQSDPAKEYEECLLKAEAVMKALVEPSILLGDEIH